MNDRFFWKEGDITFSKCNEHISKSDMKDAVEAINDVVEMFREAKIGDNMKIDKEVRDKVINNFIKDHQRLNDEVNRLLNVMKSVKTVEKFMETKRDLLLQYVRLVQLDQSTCYFCWLLEMDCDRCLYGETHGYCCSDNDSIYKRVCDTHDIFYNLIYETYIKGEKYK
jgi:hypothetical protein